MTQSSQDWMFKLTVILQITTAIVATATLVILGVFVYGPDIDGRTPTGSEYVQGLAIAVAISAACIGSAVLLKRRKKVGLWMSLAVDTFLFALAGYCVIGDINEMSTVPAWVYRDDLLIHGPLMLLLLAALLLLIASFRRATI